MKDPQTTGYGKHLLFALSDFSDYRHDSQDVDNSILSRQGINLRGTIARNGFVPRLRRDVAAKFSAFQIDTCPFANLPERKRTPWALTREEMKECLWLRPELLAQTEFTGMDGPGSVTAFALRRAERRQRSFRYFART